MHPLDRIENVIRFDEEDLGVTRQQAAILANVGDGVITDRLHSTA
ncbi:hypothetical protein DB32_000567 [Sandaracinus amylolyticus]|uniref:Uncharacterized protein n=1 Tax=Sandaracinus amylolyticus TaxID=927083 RepID=A0A0F6VZ89_9BACT|nr:hypothetical protein DB32_000567 [Sandaracinus amylolyticus]